MQNYLRFADFSPLQTETLGPLGLHTTVVSQRLLHFRQEWVVCWVSDRGCAEIMYSPSRDISTAAAVVLLGESGGGGGGSESGREIGLYHQQYGKCEVLCGPRVIPLFAGTRAPHACRRIKKLPRCNSCFEI